MNERTDRKPRSRWLYLIVCCIGLFFAGVIYSWSILKKQLGIECGWDAAQLAINFTVTISCFCIGGLISGWLMKRLGARRLLLIAAPCMLAGFVLSSGLHGGAVFMLYLVYGVPVGIGAGIAYNCFLSVAASWFPDRKGFCSGALMMSFGLSTLLLGKLEAALIYMGGFGWRRTYVLLGLITAAVIAACSLALRMPREDELIPVPSAAGHGGGREYTTAEMLRRRSFWIFFIYGMFSASIGNVVLSFAMDVSLSVGAGISAATSMVGALSLTNGCGRILWGISFDRLGMRKTLFLAGLATMLAPSLMLLALGRSSVFLTVLSLIFTGLSFGSCPTISSALIGSFYGMRCFPMNYSLSSLKLFPAAIIVSFASALLVSTGTYAAPYALLLGLALCAFVLSFFIVKP